MNKTMKKNLKVILIVIPLVIVGFLVGISINVQERLLDSHKNNIEMELTRYKQAQEICGKENVEEVTEYVNARTEETGEYTCKSFAEAAKTPEERMSEKEEERLRDDWFNYQYRGGVMSFDEWKDRK